MNERLLTDAEIRGAVYAGCSGKRKNQFLSDRNVRAWVRRLLEAQDAKTARQTGQEERGPLV